SNDSFQEFHGEHEWLFNNGRLIGGKPVPGVGWIFTPRTPVRGPKSRDAMREARRARSGPRDEIKKVQKAIAVATEEAVEPDSPKVKRRRRGRGGAPPADPVNDPLPFIEFVAAHPLGTVVEAEVESFSSHGAFVTAEDLRCYVPLTGLGDPPPRAAKEVLKRGETRQFVLQALDPPRRGIELALAAFAHVSGAPTPETVEEEIREAGRRPSSRSRRGRRPAETDGAAAPEAVDDAVAVVPTDVVVPIAGVSVTTAETAGADVEEAPPAATGAKKAGRGRKAAARPEAAPAAAERSDATPASGAPAAGARKAARSRKAAAKKVPVTPADKVAAAGAGEATPADKVAAAGAGEAAAAAGSAGAGAGEAAAAAGSPADEVAQRPAASGPKKRPARPRAGAARAEPARAPVPLASVDGGGVPETPSEVAAGPDAADGRARAKAGGASKRTPRKAAAPTPPADEPTGPEPGPPRAGSTRKRAARSAAAAPPEPAPATGSTRKRRSAAAAPGEPLVADVAPAPSKRTRRASAAPGPAAADVAAEPPSPAVADAGRARAAGSSRKATTKRAGTAAAPEPGAPAPPAKKAAARKAPTKRSAADEAPPATSPRKRGADRS
ncbi:MAG TPA: hypothetical protein VHM89_13490, partial [Acidimicrobiales bacterium]|nr:hypothetical protein [Acidimicrobiales bacterium]